MKSLQSNLAFNGRFLTLAVAAVSILASQSLASSSSSINASSSSTNASHSSTHAQEHASLHATSAHSGSSSAKLDDHPVPPKPKPKPHHRGGHHRKPPPHPAG